MHTLQLNPPHSILLYNPISGHGHLDSWHVMFALVLAERGYEVTCLTSNPEWLRSHVALCKSPQCGTIKILPLSSGPRGFSNALRFKLLQFLEWWEIISQRYTNNTLAALCFEKKTILLKVKRRLLKSAVPTLRKLVGDLSAVKRWCGYLTRFHSHIVTAIKDEKCTPSMVLHMYFDCEDHAFAQVPEFPFSWAGVGFSLSSVASELCYSMPSFRGMAMCEENAAEIHKEKHPHKQFVILPDVANATLPKKMPSLVDEILRRAAGRTVVFMGGSIGVQKNICVWGACIEQMNPQEWFFVQIGEIQFDSMDQSSAHVMHALIGSPPENFMVFTGYLADESHFNAVIAVSDILFAAYKDFPVSSNMLGKAAAFEKPILVSEGHVMARRVRQYKLGLVAPQGDVQSIIAALGALREHPIDPCGFARYRFDYSLDNLGNLLDDFLKRCIG